MHKSLKFCILSSLSLFLAQTTHAYEVVKPGGTYSFSQTTEMTMRFDPAAVAWAQDTGRNTVYGTAVIPHRQVFGGGYGPVQANMTPVSCAGGMIDLIPRSTYADQRILHYYGNLERGFLNKAIHRLTKKNIQDKERSDYERKGRIIGPDDEAYYAANLTTRCDENGGFVFRIVPDGEYYLATILGSGNDYTTLASSKRFTEHLGGLAFQKITVRGSGEHRVILNNILGPLLSPGVNMDAPQQNEHLSPATTITLQERLSPAETAWADGKGQNIVVGTATMPYVTRLDAGLLNHDFRDTTPLSCETGIAYLIPRSKYADARFSYYYGNLDQGFLSHDKGRERKKSGNVKDKDRTDFELKGRLSGPDDEIYHQNIRVAYCDPIGEFYFDNVPDGEYFIEAKIGRTRILPPKYSGKSYTQHMGGFAFKRIKVSGGQTTRVSLTNTP